MEVSIPTDESPTTHPWLRRLQQALWAAAGASLVAVGALAAVMALRNPVPPEGGARNAARPAQAAAATQPVHRYRARRWQAETTSSLMP